MTRRRVLVVVQRYGEEVTGGSEQHARLAARRLAARHEVEVATTTALDYWSWAPHYPPGLDRLDGIAVRRFAVAEGRDPGFKAFERRVLEEEHALGDELAWPRLQGPHCPALLEFLHREGRRYDAILFYTYLYEPTVLGLPLVPERAALVSTAHDEPPLRLAPYRALFHLPRAIGYLTPEERTLVQHTFRNEEVPDEVIGYALEPAPAADVAAFRAAFDLAGPYVLYLGQVTEGKGVDELLAAWAARPADDLLLVLAGTLRMPVPERPDVRAIGRVSEPDKAAALAGAEALVLPSRLESLGIVLLEAWQHGTPVLVSAANPVTVGQTARAGGGQSYADGAFAPALAAVHRDRARLGAQGRAWVERECAPAAFDERVERLVEAAADHDGRG